MPLTAQRQEVGLLLGGVLSQSRTSQDGKVDLSTGTALQANYAFRFFGGEDSKVAVLGEFHFLANPQRTIASTNTAATRDIATLFATPGIRVKFLPGGPVSPYFAVGGGYALYEQSTLQIDGAPNPAPRTIGRGAFMLGGGADFKLWRFIGLRGEIRDFYTGSPAYNIASIRGGQHNVVVSGGIVMKFQ